MKHVRLLSVLILTLVMSLNLAGEERGLVEYLPKAGEPAGWMPTGKPQYAEGEDLFSLINGGAEVYHEYGFKQAIIQGYKNKKFSFNLEIYEMKSRDAAYGVYSFKTGRSGKILDDEVGAQCLLEDYYLNFRKGNFLVTVIGFDSKPETMDALVKTAKLTAAKILPAIKGKDGKPELLKLVPDQYKEQRIFNGIIYLKGNLALFNQYPLDSKNIFDLKEGLCILYQKAKLFVFKYPGNAECKKWFKHGTTAMKAVYKDPHYQEESFTAHDKKGRNISATYHKNCIIILVNEKSSKLKPGIMAAVKSKIDKNISHGG